MKRSDRHYRIMEILNRDNFARVCDLSKKLKVSEVTMRNDLKEMELNSQLKRTHGGAVKLDGRNNYEPIIGELEQYNVEQKRLISLAAIQLIEEGDIVLMDSSSTCRQLGLRIKESNMNVTVVTNSFRTHWMLMGSENINLIHLGGATRHLMECAVGPITLNSLKLLRANKGFIGVNGIGLEGDVTTPSLQECELKRAIMERSTTTFVLSDSSKLDKVYLSVIGKIDDFDYLITDNMIPRAYADMVRASNCGLIIAKENKQSVSEKQL